MPVKDSGETPSKEPSEAAKDLGDLDVRKLARWLGPEGARAGLEKSKYMTLDVLRRVAVGLGIPAGPKAATRQQLIGEIVRVANRRIDRPAKELMSLSEDQLVEYLETVEAGRDELLDLLKEIDATPSKESRKGLIRFAARELSETGRFVRIASSGSAFRPEDEPAKKQ